MVSDTALLGGAFLASEALGFTNITGAIAGGGDDDPPLSGGPNIPPGLIEALSARPDFSGLFSALGEGPDLSGFFDTINSQNETIEDLIADLENRTGEAETIIDFTFDGGTAPDGIDFSLFKEWLSNQTETDTETGPDRGTTRSGDSPLDPTGPFLRNPAQWLTNQGEILFKGAEGTVGEIVGGTADIGDDVVKAYVDPLNEIANTVGEAADADVRRFNQLKEAAPQFAADVGKQTGRNPTVQAVDDLINESKKLTGGNETREVSEPSKSLKDSENKRFKATQRTSGGLLV